MFPLGFAVFNEREISMKIYAFADETGHMIDHQIEAMQRNKLDGLEIRIADGIVVSDLPAAHAKEIRKKMDDAGLAVWSIGSPIGKVTLAEDFNAHLEKFKHTLEIASLLGSSNIRLFSFFIPKGCDYKQHKNEVIDRLGQMLLLADGTGIDLCHENESGIYGDLASRCLELFGVLPKLKGIFDPANFVQCGQETAEAWAMLHPYIKYLHIKDALADGKVVPAGRGIGKLPFIVGEFAKQGGQAMTIEPHLMLTDDPKVSGYPTKDAAFDAACDAAKAVLSELGV